MSYQSWNEEHLSEEEEKKLLEAIDLERGRSLDKYKQIKTKENYQKLLSSGMFFEFYPELSGVWKKDVYTMIGFDKKPKQLEIIDTKELRKICQEYVDFLDNENRTNDQDAHDHYLHLIAGKAMTTFFGKYVLDYIRYKEEG